MTQEIDLQAWMQLFKKIISLNFTVIELESEVNDLLPLLHILDE